MADTYTSTTTVPNLVTAAYDRYIRLALRAMPQFRTFADTRPVQQTHPGSSVIFSLYSDMADATTTLNEVTDPEIQAIADPSRITVTLNEYGNYAVVTKKLQAFSLDGSLDANLANMLAFNQASSIDTVVQTVLAGTTNFVRESAGSLSTVAAITTIVGSDTAKARDFRYPVTKLRANNVMGTRGEHYAVVLHPEVAHDLRIETGSTGWRTPHEYVDTGNIYAAEIGTFEGGVFIESPRCLNSQRGSGAGASQVRVYDSYVFGKEALAEAVAIEPHTVVNGAIVDPLDRKMSIGWYGLFGHSLFRPEALYKVQTASTVRPTV